MPPSRSLNLSSPDSQFGDIHRNLLDLSFNEFDILAKVNNSSLFIRKSRNLIGLIRNLFTQLFSILRREVAINNQRHIELTLKKITLIPLLIFVNSPRNTAKVMEDNLKRMLDDDWTSFTIESLHIRQLPNGIVANDASRQFKASALLEEGYIAKSYKMLSQKPLATVNETNGALNTLVKLHPVQHSIDMLSEIVVEGNPSTQEFIDRIEHLVADSNRPQVRQPNNAAQISIEDKDLLDIEEDNIILIKPTHVLDSLKNMKRNRAPGPSKLRKEHLKQLIGKNESNEEKSFLGGLSHFLTLIANNSLPASFMNWLASADLIAISKDENDLSNVRPIALGDTYRKIVGSVLLSMNRLEIIDFFDDGDTSPLNFTSEEA
jgi:hypothetical protein